MSDFVQGRGGSPVYKPLVPPAFTDMTLRDFFAANAPHTRQDAFISLSASGLGPNEIRQSDIDDELVKIRFRYADMMMQERSR